jgi:hypothetical protein
VFPLIKNSRLTWKSIGANPIVSERQFYRSYRENTEWFNFLVQEVVEFSRHLSVFGREGDGEVWMSLNE